MIWTASYFLYLPATIAYVVSELLPVAFPRIVRAGPWLELGIPLVIVLGVAAWRTGVLAVIGLLAVAQVFVVGLLAAAPATHALPRVNSFVPSGSASELTLGAVTVSLFFLCSSLPLYLGGEVRRPTRLLRRALPVSVGVGGACVLAAAVALARVPANLETGPFPGWAVAYAVGGHALAVAVATGTALKHPVAGRARVRRPDPAAPGDVPGEAGHRLRRGRRRVPRRLRDQPDRPGTLLRPRAAPDAARAVRVGGDSVRRLPGVPSQGRPHQVLRRRRLGDGHAPDGRRRLPRAPLERRH